jgi:hypothetical protein
MKDTKPENKLHQESKTKEKQNVGAGRTTGLTTTSESS